jgi:DNA repair exonuclease SbcCD nuclease subunit
MKTLIVNDLHEGVQRSGGTTLASAAALRAWAHERHRELLGLAVKHKADVVIVNGDLSDAYDIPLGEGLEVLSAAKDFLDANPDKELVWVLGNHDLSKDSSRLGIVAFLGTILEGWFPERFRLVRKPVDRGDFYIIPHMVNQDQFDLALSQVPDGVKYLLLHCNYDNTFAGALDHSLNVSRDQVRKFRDRNIKVILGHEHQHRTLMNGNLIIVGNQFPTSVADCLPHGDGQKDGKKYCLLIDSEGDREAQVQHIETWSADDPDGWFEQVDWQELTGVTEDGRGFVRVAGEATATQAADVIKAISAFRQRSQSFVITNAVKVEGVESSQEELLTQEDIRQIDVIALLLELLEEKQAAKVCELLGRTVPTGESCDEPA